MAKIILGGILALLLLCAMPAAFGQDEGSDVVGAVDITGALQTGNSSNAENDTTPESQTDILGDAVEHGSTSDLLENETEAFGYDEGEELKGILGTLLGDERINVVVEGGNNYYMITENKKWTDSGKGLLDDPTMTIYVSKPILDQLKAKEITVLDALKAGVIKFEGEGFIKSVKTLIVSTLAKWFG